MFSGADSSLFANPTATAAAQGTYWPTTIVPIDLTTRPPTAFVANLKKYDSVLQGRLPELRADRRLPRRADLMIKGLTVAGQNPTRQVVHRQPDQGAGWNADGLLPSTSRVRTTSGPPEQTLCGYFTKVQGNQFVTINNGKPFCGNLIPNSNASSG